MSLTSDKVQAFPTLEDPVTSAGVPLAKVLEGDASAAKNASAALVATNAAGNLQYLKVNASNELIVSSDSAQVACLSDSGNVTGNNVTEQTVVTIVLQQSLEYRKIGWSVSNFRQTEYRIVHVADVGVTDVETEINTILVGPGHYNDSAELTCLNFTTSGVGVQELRLVGINKDAASQLRGTISAQEVQ